MVSSPSYWAPYRPYHTLTPKNKETGSYYLTWVPKFFSYLQEVKRTFSGRAYSLWDDQKLLESIQCGSVSYNFYAKIPSQHDYADILLHLHHHLKLYSYWKYLHFIKCHQKKRCQKCSDYLFYGNLYGKLKICTRMTFFFLTGMGLWTITGSSVYQIYIAYRNMSFFTSYCKIMKHLDKKNQPTMFQILNIN